MRRAETQQGGAVIVRSDPPAPPGWHCQICGRCPESAVDRFIHEQEAGHPPTRIEPQPWEPAVLPLARQLAEAEEKEAWWHGQLRFSLATGSATSIALDMRHMQSSGLAAQGIRELILRRVSMETRAEAAHG